MNRSQIESQGWDQIISVLKTLKKNFPGLFAWGGFASSFVFPFFISAERDESTSDLCGSWTSVSPKKKRNLKWNLIVYFISFSDKVARIIGGWKFSWLCPWCLFFQNYLWNIPMEWGPLFLDLLAFLLIIFS